MIHAYQTGKLHKASPEVRGMAQDISPTNVGHFAKTKHKKLPEHVKQSSAVKDIIATTLHKQDPAHHPDPTVDRVDKLEKELKEKTEKPAVSLEYSHNKKAHFMNKEAFERGFIKSAIANGVQPLLAIRLLKAAHFNLGNIAEAVGAVGHNPDALGAAVVPGAIGAGLGGAAGYMHGENEDPAKNHSGRDALLGALGGGALGAAGGAVANTNSLYNNVKSVMAPRVTAEANQIMGQDRSQIGKLLQSIHGQLPDVNPSQGLDSNFPNGELKDLKGYQHEIGSMRDTQNSVNNGSFLKSLVGMSKMDPYISSGMSHAESIPQTTHGQ